MDLLKLWKKANNHKCIVCKGNITMEGLKLGNVIYSQTKRKTILFVHKNCLVKRGD